MYVILEKKNIVETENSDCQGLGWKEVLTTKVYKGLFFFLNNRAVLYLDCGGD